MTGLSGFPGGPSLRPNFAPTRAGSPGRTKRPGVYSARVTFVLGQDSAPAKRDPVGSAAQLWLILAVGGVVFLILVGVVFHRHTLRMRETREHHERARKRSIPDAWAEAGRRMTTPPAHEAAADDDAE